MTKKETYLQAYKEMRDFWMAMKNDSRLDEWNGKVYNKRFPKFIEESFEAPQYYNFRATVHDWKNNNKQVTLILEEKRTMARYTTVSLYTMHGKDTGRIGFLDESGKRIDIAIFKELIQKTIIYLDERIEILEAFNEEEAIKEYSFFRSVISKINNNIPFELAELRI